MEKVAVVIPSYNHKQYVNDAIKSVICQGLCRPIVILIDDASTDKTFEDVLQYVSVKKEGNGIVDGELHGGVPITMYRLTERKGQSFARNLGVKLIQQDVKYIAFLDADDYYLPSKLQESIKRFDNPAVGFVYSDCRVLDVDNGYEYNEYFPTFSADNIVKDCVGHAAAVVSKEAFYAVGGFDVDMPVCEDFDFWLRISKKYVGLHIPKILYCVRRSKLSLLNTVSNDVWLHNQQRALCKRQ
jgi:glycosyltransferase involved in cell wall biosynthesis